MNGSRVAAPLVKWTGVTVAALPVALIATSLLIGSTPDEEEFRFAILTTWLHASAVLQGHYAFWTPLLGLGVPQPLTPNFFLHPLIVLLPALGPIAWGRALVIAHTLLGAAGMWQLTKSLAISPVVRGLCVVSFLLATPAQNYVLSDFWPSHYVVWTSAPWLLLLAWRVLAAEGPALRRASVVLGLSCGLVVANTNPGHVIVYVTLATSVVIANWRRVAARWQWFGAAVLLAAAIASPNLVQLAHERAVFSPDIQLSNVPDPLPAASLWSALFSPIPAPSALPFNEQLPFTRTLFFGGPFLALCLAGCVWFVRARLDLVLAAVASAVVLFTSFVSLPGVSARFQFRDPLTLAAILLAGLTLTRLLSIRATRALAAAVAIVQVFVVVGSALPVLERTWTADARRARRFRGAAADTTTVDRLLSLMPIRGRVVFSPEVDRASYDQELLGAGLGVNALAYRGVPVVNGWFKGISADRVWPDERLYYARIRAPGAFVTSGIDLDVLGIRYVVAQSGESVAPGLVNRGTLRLGSGPELTVYENGDAWPEAFLVDHVRPAETPVMPGCENDRLLCRDLGDLAHQRLAARVMIAASDGSVDVELTPTDRPVTVVITRMFRPDWVATVDGHSVRPAPIADALLGVELPAGARSVRVRYSPTGVIVATVAGWIALLGAVAGLLLRNRVPGFH